MYIYHILHQNRAQKIIQYHDNNILKQMSFKKYLILMRPIFNKTCKGKKKVEIYMQALYQKLVLFLQSKNCFCYVPENEIKEDILGWTTSSMFCYHSH